MTTKIVVLEEYKEEVRPEVKAANAFQITDTDSMSSAVELMSKLGKGVDMIEAYEKVKTEKWKAKVKAVTTEVAPMKKAVKTAYQIMRDKVAEYQMKAEAEASAKQAKIAEKMMKGQLKPETASKKAEMIEVPDEKVATVAGSVSFTTTKKLEIVDLSKIPAEYLVVDEKKLLDALKAGVLVPGAQIKEVKSVRNYR